MPVINASPQVFLPTNTLVGNPNAFNPAFNGLSTKNQNRLQAQLNATSNNVFAKDLPYLWRGQGFPSSNFRLRIRQDLAEHKYSDKDGAEMEPTGRAPIEFTVRIPFLNSLKKGPNETWTEGALYPTALTEMIRSMADRNKGVMQHPLLGFVTCVPHEFDVEWNASTRDGTWATATWIETFSDDNNLTSVLSVMSPLPAAIAYAQDLDKLIFSIQPALPESPTFTPNFADTLRGIQGIFDTATLLSTKVAGAINNVGYRVNAILDSINQASNAPQNAVHSVMNGPARVACDRLTVACANLKNQVAHTGKSIGLYMTAGPTTLPDLVLLISTFNNHVEPNTSDLIKLNGPSIVSGPIIPANTTVRYYLDGKSQPFHAAPPPVQNAPF